jgi:arginine decarboxylase
LKKNGDDASNWSLEKSENLYGIKYWGAKYFRINQKGNVEITPQGPEGPSADLHSLVEDLKEGGIRVPILLRFPDIIKARIDLLTGSFTKAIQDYNYKAEYRGVYPIKVNQQRHLVEEIVGAGQNHKFGLEAGSKPELLVTLALMDTPDALIVCNGFKDLEYIEMALISLKMGRNTFIVVDRASELKSIVQAAKRLDVKPRIGFRCKLNTQGAGRWTESSGARSKFGLSPSEIVEGVEYLRNEGLLESLQLLHFHIGSQVPSIQAIKGAIKEGARFFTELYALGAPLQYIDVGGGLGVDYDGSGKSDSSINYSEQEYANDVVFTLQQICDEKKVPHPNIISESGRSLISHSTVLIFDVLGKNEMRRYDEAVEDIHKQHSLIRELNDIYCSLTKENLNEAYNDLVEKKKDTLQLFTYGVLSLEQRAKAENLYWAIATKMVGLAKDNPDVEDIHYALEQELSDTYFCNFSIFQSLPDSWALGQVFPVMPLHRLNERPDRRAVLVDLTCDSDGHIKQFIDIDANSTQTYLEVHNLNKGEPYYIGVFLTGAYQEILGDLHNLFGDTDLVHVAVGPNGYSIEHVVEGDEVREVLAYVAYQRSELLDKIRRSTEAGIARGTLSRQEARLLLENYERGLSSYTYLAGEVPPQSTGENRFPMD